MSLQILDDSRKWWKARNIRGQVAHVPHTIVTPHACGCDDSFQRQVSCLMSCTFSIKLNYTY